METNLKSRVAHTPLPKSNGLLPLYETVINSIHAIEEGKVGMNDGKITIRIIRSPVQLDLLDAAKRGPDPDGDILSFEIEDNGVGFNDSNMKSFQTLDSDYKETRYGGFGVGRLTWLKAFERAQVESVYSDVSGDFQQRRFTFDAKGGVTDRSEEGTKKKFTSRYTKITLEGFLESYREASKKTAESIARGILEHCLWYFLREGSAPHIYLIDGDNIINLDSVFRDSLHSNSSSSEFHIGEQKFTITHVKLKTNSSQTHTLGYCATDRLVKEESIRNKVPGLYGRIDDEHGDFVYAGYITSEYLTKHVRTGRFEFDIVESQSGIFENEVTFSEIRQNALEEVGKYLAEYIKANKTLGNKRIENFVNSKAPKYKPVLDRLLNNGFSVDPDISDSQLDLELHRQLSEFEHELLLEGHDIMVPTNTESKDEYLERLSGYLSKVVDLKRSDLAQYVSHRKVIIDLLDNAIQKQSDGKYSREDLIHEMIMPMRKDSTKVLSNNMNLWLVDERLAFHDYLASDIPLSANPTTGNIETKEPDLAGLNVYDNPLLTTEGTKLPLASITIIELKRPMRNDAKPGGEKDPLEQSLGYLERIRNGEVKTYSGRLIPNSSDIPGYCYVICDITPSIEKRCKMMALQITSDKMGYFGYNENYKAYIEVISFDRLVNMAKERNRAFFDALGLPST